MDYFQYQNNQLFCEDLPVEQIINQVNTPAYLYSTTTFKHHLQNYQKAFAELDPLICYSVKACGNINILKQLAQWGSGFDVVSGGELFRVLQASGKPDQVVFAGVGKTDEELNQAIDAGIAFFNIESEAEFENLAHLAQLKNNPVHGALRVNPDVDPKTHRHTTTGKRGNKFGVDHERAMDVFARYGQSEWVKLSCIHIHIGSPVNTVEPYVLAITKTLDLIDRLRHKGFNIQSLIIGGGFGADYVTNQAPLTADYAKQIIPLLRGKNLRLVLEPGRSIAGNAGILLTRVLYTKQAGEKKMVIVDAAMNDLIRPALYDAFHFIWPVKTDAPFNITDRTDPVNSPGTQVVDIVGPICESVDFLAKDRALPPLKRGDLLAVFTAGAYGFVMSSQYNARPRAAEVLVEKDQFKLIRRREIYEDLISHELI
jgi:diaminopimelate decarboxylase